MTKNEDNILISSVPERRMPFQPPLKVSVPNIVIHYSSVSIGPGLMWRESWPQTTLLGAQMWIDLLIASN